MKTFKVITVNPMCQDFIDVSTIKADSVSDAFYKLNEVNNYDSHLVLSMAQWKKLRGVK